MEDREDKGERFIELYESILEKEDRGCSYRSYSKDLNEYVAWICYRDVIYEYNVVRKKKESRIYDKWGNIMKAVVRVDSEGVEKWLSLCEWDEKARKRGNRYYAENVALAKLFNRVLREIHNLWIKYNEELWEKTEDGEELYVKKLSYGDMAYIKKVESGYEYWCLYKKEETRGRVAGGLKEAQEGLFKMLSEACVRRMQAACKTEKMYNDWVSKKEEEGF